MNLTQARTCVCNVNYHLVWSIKYRRPVLTDEIEERMKEIFHKTGEEKDFIVHQIEIGENDHVHVMSMCPLTHKLLLLIS